MSAAPPALPWPQHPLRAGMTCVHRIRLRRRCDPVTAQTPGGRCLGLPPQPRAVPQTCEVAFYPHCLEEGRTVGWLRGGGGVGSTRRKGQVPREVLSPGQRQLRLSLKRAALAARLEEKRPTWAGGLWSPPPERTALPPGSEGGERAMWSHTRARVCHAFRFFARQGLFQTSCVKVPPARNTGRVLFEDGAMATSHRNVGSGGLSCRRRLIKF